MFFLLVKKPSLSFTLVTIVCLVVSGYTVSYLYPNFTPSQTFARLDNTMGWRLDLLEAGQGWTGVPSDNIFNMSGHTPLLWDGQTVDIIIQHVHQTSNKYIYYRGYKTTLY